MKQFFQDDTGKFSIMRLCQLLVVAAIIFVFLVANIVASINAIVLKSTTVSIVDFKEQMILALLVVIGGKVVQSFSESKGSIEQKPKE